MTSKITPIILSGGSGTRLWPLSTDAQPKQFLPLTSEKSLLEETLIRVSDPNRFAPPLIIGAERHASHLVLAAPEHQWPHARIILEPCARNTAPAIALGALAAEPDALLLVMPSDHVIADPDAFQAAIDDAKAAAASGWLVTFGISPTSPDTGFGYIQMGDAISPSSPALSAEKFLEKPDLGAAQAMLSQGGFSWNAGIFLMRADRYLQELALHAPAMAAAADQAMHFAGREGRFILPDAEAFASSPADSIDYAVMEKADKVAVVPVSCGWSDVGNWDAIYDVSARDGDGNTLSGDSLAIASQNCLVRADGVSVSLVGTDGLVVVATPDHVLIMRRGKAQDVKKIVEMRK